MIQVLFNAGPELWETYEAPLAEALRATGLPFHVSTEIAPVEADYMVYAPHGARLDFAPYSRLKAVLSLWAGVETILGNDSLQVPLCRMVDPSLTDGMVEWVTGHVLRHHLGMDTHILGQDGVWRANSVPPLARDRRVTILGLGALGQAAAQALVALNFRVTGWSRSPKDVEGVRCFSGPSGLHDALDGAEIVVLLLPQTPETDNVLDGPAMARMAKGSFVINPGRGPLIDDDALLAALESGQVGHATLDVFRTEPLPEAHAFWSHPNVTVTPHIASETRPVSASQMIAENIRRGEAGLPFLNQVDLDAGY